jgi:hypothetical protein
MPNEHEITCGGCRILLLLFMKIILEMILFVSSDDPANLQQENYIFPKTGCRKKAAAYKLK